MRFFGIWRGSPTSLDDDRTEHTPVRLPGVEQGSYAVVLEVAEPEVDPLDALDQVVERFGWSVGHPGQVEVGDLVEPGLESASEPLDLGRHGAAAAVLLELSRASLWPRRGRAFDRTRVSAP